MRSILVIVLLSWLTMPAMCDQLFLSNGDRISGKILLEAGNVIVTSPIVGAVKIPRTAVVRIIMEKPNALSVMGRTVDAAEVTLGSKDATVILKGGTRLIAPSASITSPPATSLHDSHLAKLLNSWNTSFDTGFTAARGNTALNNLRLGFRAVQTTDSHRLSLAFNSLLAENVSRLPHVSTADAIHSSARYEFNITNHLFGFGLASFDSDSLQHLDLRSVYGGGIGIRFADAPAGTLDLFSGGTFDAEDFSDNINRKSGELLAGAESTYHLFSRTSTTHRLIVFPNLTSPGNYRVNLDSMVLVKLSNWLGWQFSLTNMYLSNPLLGSRNNDLLVTTGIRLTLGRDRTFKPRSKVSPLPICQGMSRDCVTQ